MFYQEGKLPHLEQVETDNFTPPELVEYRDAVAEITEGWPVVWEAWRNLHTSRAIGMAPCPIAWRDMESYFRMARQMPTWHELEALRALDLAWLGSQGKRKPPPQPRDKDGRRSRNIGTPD